MNLYIAGMIGAGAAVGAWVRWGLGIVLNPLFTFLPLGTLAANMIGGYLMGIALVLLEGNPLVSPEMRLMATTGFLGGLTTFSTFSGESVTLFTRGEYGWMSLLVVSHVAGSILMTFLGVLTVRWVKSWGIG